MALSMESASVQWKLSLKNIKTIYKCAVGVASSPDPVRSVHQLKARCNDLEKIRSDFYHAHTFILTNGKAGQIDEAGLDQTYDEFGEMFYSIQSIYSELSDKCASIASTASHSAKPVSNSDIKLPRIELIKFSGNYTEWDNFISIFNSLVHTNEGLNDVKRFQYLLSSLEKEPLTLVRHLPKTEANYSVAYTLLSERYDNKRLIAETHLDAIMTLRCTQLGIAQLRHFVNTIKESTQALSALKYDVKAWSFLLFHILSRKLPNELRSKFEEFRDPKDIPTFNELLVFLEKQLRIMENVDPGVKSHTKSVRSGSNCLATLDHACPCCSGSHDIHRCDKFDTMTPEQRKGFVTDHKLCYNCLRTHMISHCKSSSTCRVCGSRHHTKLHTPSSTSNLTLQSTDASEAAVSTFGSTVQAASSSSVHAHSTVLLATALVDVMDIDGRYHQVRALLDPGSQVSVMTEDTARKLRLPRLPSGRIDPLGAENVHHPKGRVVCTIKPCLPHPQCTFTTSASILKCIVRQLPTAYISDEVLSACKNYELADPCFHIPGPVDLLIGADLYDEIDSIKKIKLGTGLPSVYSTALGNVLLGKAPVSSAPQDGLTSLACTIDDALHRFWESEEPPQLAVPDPENVQCEKHFVDTHSRDETGRFIVRLPFKTDHKQLGSTRTIALKRFQLLERKLARDPKLKELYVAFMHDYLEAGHMRLVPPQDCQDRYHIPHHGVLKESSSTTKLRAVFDASMPSSTGVALNHILMPGAKLQQTIDDIILRFRLHKVVFTADVKQMYRQVRMHEDDCKFQTIFWREAPDSPIQQYELTTVTYGVSSAAYLAMRVLHELALLNSRDHPAATLALQQDIFVDDIVTGSNSVESAKILQSEIISVLSQGGFQLRKWSSNHSDLLDHLPSDHRETPLRFEEPEDRIFKILGLEWNAHSDEFLYEVENLSTSATTKREILSSIARLYDPCGYLAPLTFFAKAFMQSLWILELSWDEPLPPEFLRTWSSFISNFPQLKKIRIARCVLTDDPVICELHGFSDASDRGYAAVVYLRVQDSSGRASVHLLLSKSRVAPLKQKLTIPRLELCGAALLARLINHVHKVLHPRNPIASMSAWCDSTIVLAWLRTPPHKLQVYEGNRVTQIQSFLSAEHWRYVPSALNPADCASRGLLPHELVGHPLWWSPTWLSGDPATWPLGCTLIGELPGLRANEVSAAAVADEQDILGRYSSLSRLLSVIGFCLRFAHNSKYGMAKESGVLTLHELDNALHVAIKIAQQSHFADVISEITSNKQIKGPLQRLNPFMDAKGILRVGGRLVHSDIPYEAKHPAILPKGHHLTRILIEYYHRLYCHVGPAALIAILQRRFWILSARSAVRSVTFRCLQCFKLKAKPSAPYMGDLPASRATPSKTFQHCGADFAGPFIIKSSNLRGTKTHKAYLCIFVCFATKAVHLEVVSDLSTDAFIACLTRFVSRRGIPSNINSDCGSNFIGARRHLSDVYKYLGDRTIQTELRTKATRMHINWHLNAPLSPHMGGLWETAVKSAKGLMKRVIGEQILNFEELQTVFSKIEAVLNSRPLCPVSNDPTDTDVLTPGHFLIGQPLLALPEYDHQNTSTNRLSRWQLTQQISQRFWRRWQQEYLHTLQQRPKWTKHQHNLKVGDLVLLQEQNLPPLQWRSGRISKVFPGADGTVRVVEVRTAHSTFVRPVVRIIPLPVDA